MICEKHRPISTPCCPVCLYEQAQQLESDKAELLEALDELIAAEWMVSPSWSSTEMREALLARIEAATNKHRS